MKSTFATLHDARRFVEWYEEPGQIVSDWDKFRYQEALAMLRASKDAKAREATP